MVFTDFHCDLYSPFDAIRRLTQYGLDHLRGTANVMTRDMQTFFHYCSIDAFVSILSTRILRLSDVAHMNDSHECRWADRVVERVLNDINGQV